MSQSTVRRRRGTVASRVDAVVLAHGAGSGPDHHTLLALDEALSARLDRPVIRHMFPYRAAGKRPPDREPVLRASLLDAVAATGVRSHRVLIGGRSLGGRRASLIAADDIDVAGLVLLAYPLHPPGKPERLRTEHFGRLRCPTLFVSGTKDPFGTPDEFSAALEGVAAPHEMVWLPGVGHDPARHDVEIVAAVQSWLDSST
jgi:uncharacterized protein